MATIYIHKIDLTKDAGTITQGLPLYPDVDLYPSQNLYPGGLSFIDVCPTEWFEAYDWDTGMDNPFNTFNVGAKIKLPKWYPHVGQEIGTPKNKILVKKVTIEGEGSFDAEVYREDYNKTYTKSHEQSSIQDLDLHVNSRVDKCDISISDSTPADFKIKSLVIEGLFNPTSRTLR